MSDDNKARGDLMTDYHKSEDGGFFYLSWMNNTIDFDDDSLGRGSSQHNVRFSSGEAREYFIQKMDLEQQLKCARSSLRYFQNGLLECLTKTGRVRHKKVVELAKVASFGVAR